MAAEQPSELIWNMMKSAIVLLILLFALAANGQSQQPEPQPRKIVGLKYPRLALLAAIQGTTVVEAIVAADGTVKGAVTVSGHPILAEAAVASVRKWRFEDCSRSNSECRFRIEFVFRLAPGLCDIGECPNDLEIDLPNKVILTSKAARAIVN